MKILMLVNWKIKYCDSTPTNMQSPDYFVKGKPYWFFRYFPKDTQVDVVDCSSFPALEKFEQNTIRFYVYQTIRVLPRLNKYDFVISHGMQSGIVLCLFRRLFGKGKYKHIVIDVGAFNSAKESGKALKLMQYASKSLDGVIYHTPSQIDYYRKCHPWLVNKSRYIMFGTELEFFSKIENDIESKNSHGGKIKHYIVCVGYHQRDWKTLLDAFKLVDNEVNLRIIGNDNIITDDTRIESIGKLPIRDLVLQIKNADFCVLPLENNNYSFGQMTLLQQMLLSKAVIVADVPSVAPYIIQEDGVPNNLSVYQSKNKTALAGCITRLLNDKKYCMALGKKARKSVVDRFSDKIMAASIYDYLSERLFANEK